ncbi:hypothetical protein [Azospirillum brasilense]|nr:hypothetical protein [Azospirillum brasilense]
MRRSPEVVTAYLGSAA